MSSKSTFGAEPEGIDRLLAMGLEESSHQERVGPTASWGGLLEKPGCQIGRYKLLNVLGEGGMGIVYLAEQQVPIKRRVALKVIKPGMDSKRVIGRFEAERQALALLNHPNIAHVYDAGTTDSGRPYFVMEYVKGMPVTEHSDRHKLSIEDRLNLFLQVCHAVHHAHQKGIIHRDIKPSNILVSVQDDQAIPKIIDFGVAKAIAQPLTERTLFTEDSQLLGTPEYMSPEQADMASEDIDTRSDIYSLGVLLYVLLTGMMPFDPKTFRKGGVERIRQVIREANPKTPSTRLTKLGEEAKKLAEKRRTEVAALAKRLHKELEWIPLKAMRKERSERYRSALELADDIENYLKGAPLIAGPPSTVYRVKKFVRRHKALVTGIAAVMAVLIAGIIISALFAFGQSRARAEAQAIADFLQNGIEALTIPGQAKGTEVSLHDLLTEWSKKLEGSFDDKPLVEASIRATLGWAYRYISEPTAAEPHLERALQIRMEYLGPEHPQTLISTDRLAWLRWDQGHPKETAELVEKALSISRCALGDAHNVTLTLVNTLGCVYATSLGRYDEAEQLYIRGLRTARRVLGEKNALTLMMLLNLGQVYRAQRLYNKAEHQYLELLQLYNGSVEGETYPALCKSFLGQVYIDQKRYAEAKELYLEVIPIQRRVVGNQHWHTLRSMSGLARVHTHLDEYNEAEILFTEILDARKLKLGDDHPVTLESKNDLAVLYKEQEHYQEAEKLLLEAVEGRRRKLGDEHPSTLASINALVELYEAWGKPEKAEQWRAKLPQTEAVEE